MKKSLKKRAAKKRQVIVIGGGDSFRTSRDAIRFLKAWRIDFESYRRKHLPGWKATLGAELGRSFEVIRVDMPNTLDAHYAEWKIWFEKFIPHLNREVMFVGHSLGALFLAKYLSENRFPKKIRATLLVAPPWSEGDFRLGKSLARLEKQGGALFIYQSKDDRVVPFGEALARYERQLPGATVRIFKNRGHFNQPHFHELVRDIKACYA